MILMINKAHPLRDSVQKECESWIAVCAFSCFIFQGTVFGSGYLTRALRAINAALSVEQFLYQSLLSVPLLIFLLLSTL